jgi:uncharacterized heparinase superfamily protein
MAWRLLAPKVLREKNTSRSSLENDAFTFNNVTRVFTGDWNDPGARKLWLYNLHYMGWIFDITGDGAPIERENWILRWARENPPASGNGWEPYPLSLRIFNWCKHYASVRVAPREDVRELMERQSGYLLANLEFHLDANHLLENLLALAYAGFHLDPASRSSRRALARVGTLLDAELDGQFLADGGHYELSPMYHAILLERLLDLLNVWPDVDDPFPGLRAKMQEKALKGLDWLDAMSVGGAFSLFNDACYDAAPEAERLLDFGTRLLGWKRPAVTALRSLTASGYHRAEAGSFTLIFDAGKLGPDHQMGHAQGDMLSFCLWVSGVPVLVHPGNYEYVAGEMRDYCRSTAAHNTFAPEGAEQAEWWGSHRVGWRGKPLSSGGGEDSSGDVLLWATHDGYSRMPGKPLHTRRIRMNPSAVVIEDELSSRLAYSVAARLHLHPDCAVEVRDSAAFVRVPGGVLRLETDATLRVENGWHCPEFGLRRRNAVLVAEARGRALRTTITFLENP